MQAGHFAAFGISFALLVAVKDSIKYYYIKYITVVRKYLIS